MTLTEPVLDYSDAKSFVHEFLRVNPRLATSVKRTLACLIVDKVVGAGKGAEPTSYHEREAALHIRKMVAEGEILEEMQGKRLYYKSPCSSERTSHAPHQTDLRG